MPLLSQRGLAFEWASGVSTIDAAIARRAAIARDSVAFADAEAREITFSQLQACIATFADVLGGAGLRREDRLGVLVPVGIAGGQLVAALASNLTVVPVNPALTSREVIEIAEDHHLAGIVLPEWLEAPARSMLDELPIAVLEAAVAADDGLHLRVIRRRGPAAPLRLSRPADVALLLRSSGSTGAPKIIAVTHGNLVAMAEKLASPRWFALTPEDRVSCTLPLYYAAGLKTSLLVPLILGQTVGFPPTGKAFDIAEWIDALRPTYLSVAPASLHRMVDRLRASARRLEGGSLRFVMCAAAYLSEDLRLAAESMLGVPVIEFYGLSEAGVMAANPAPPGKIKPGTVGLPATGELLVVDENRQPIRDGAVGQIMISGPTVTPGYVSQDNSSAFDLKDGWLLTGDLGCIDSDGYLSIVGRVKEVINRGGEKVFPYEIEKALLQHPAISDAAAFGVPHPRLGENVAAVAVLKPGNAVSEQALKQFLATRLAGFKLPRRVHFVGDLPRGSTGKVLRRSLTAAYAVPSGDLALPNHLLEFELRDLWKRLLRTNDIGIDDDFMEKGGDSLLATEMLVEVERLTGKPYPQSELSTLTIRRIHEVVRSDALAQHEVITQVRSGSGIPLFFCHGDYLTRGIYAQKLAALLPDDRPVFLLHCYADRLMGASIESMAREYAREVTRVAPHSPVLIAGFCNGGLAAWHLAHLLSQDGVEVVRLLLIETLSLNARTDLRALAKVFRIAGSMMPGRIGDFLQEQAMAVVWTWKRGFVGLATLAARAFRNKLLPVLMGKAARTAPRDVCDMATQSYLGLMSRFVPTAIAIDVDCFIAKDGRHYDTDPRFWHGLATSVSEVSVPGTHFSAIISEREALTTAFGRALKQVRRNAA
ncbi:MAG TPA: AMP-binding protein [Burkholderiales bacterium]|nr:AMP-binding protein [Burkholderiales bacterium]